MKNRYLTGLMGLLAGVLFCFGPSARASEGAPQVREELKQVPQRPYDDSANAQAEVEAAKMRAIAEHKFVLLDFGGNWCPDCRVTAGVLALGDVRPWVDGSFETVMIDVGRINKNLDIARQYGVKISAVPTIIILDPNGHMINAGNPAALQDARGMTPQAIVDTIYGWIHNPA
jgi:thiol-disulfide isomerase/thioredoxin